jgi:hypothetical protein
MLYEFEKEREDPRLNLIRSLALQFPVIIPPLSILISGLFSWDHMLYEFERERENPIREPPHS